MAPKTKAPRFVLPPAVSGPIELGRLLREIEAIDESLFEEKLRHKGSAKLTHPSQLLDLTLETNQLSLESKEDRATLVKYLWAVKQKAPVVHMSLGADPTSEFINKIVGWLRSEVHPFVLLTIGLQPTIGAGCMLRTTNKFFDMSLKHGFADKKDMLIKLIGAKPEAAQ